MKFYDEELAESGLLLQGVVDASGIDLKNSGQGYAQLLVVAHGGATFWRQLNVKGADPLDETATQLAHSLMQRLGESDYEIIYPADHFALDLIGLGKKLGWHHDSKLAIGINPEYGTWFAYRFVIAANTVFDVSQYSSEHPCDSCTDRPCIIACPAGAVTESGFVLQKCLDERLRPGSECVDSCAARLACPIASEHRYDAAQINYHYGRSYVSLKKYQER